MLHVLLFCETFLLVSSAIVIACLVFDHRRLMTQLTIDPLMQIGSRALFEQVYPTTIAHACRTREALTLLFIDLNDLKLLNSLYGHPGADRILCALGGVVAKSVRSSDIVCRIGGDECVAILPNTTAEQANVLVERIREAVRNERVLMANGDVATFGVSIGGASLVHPSDRHGKTTEAAQELLDRANRLMLAAKLLKGSVENPILFQ